MYDVDAYIERHQDGAIVCIEHTDENWTYALAQWEGIDELDLDGFFERALGEKWPEALDGPEYGLIAVYIDGKERLGVWDKPRRPLVHATLTLARRSERPLHIPPPPALVRR